MKHEILRIETSADSPPRKRYVCACGRVGPWDQEGWRNRKQYTADRLVEWNWRVHAGNMGQRRPIDTGRHCTEITSTKMPDGSELCRWLCSCGSRSYGASGPGATRWNAKLHALSASRRDADSVHATATTAASLVITLSPAHLQRLADAANATGRTLQDFARDTLLQTLNAARIPADLKPGVLVEWEPEYASGTMRGTVTRVEHGRVFLTVARKAKRRKPVETWFEPDEVHRLRVVAP